MSNEPGRSKGVQAMACSGGPGLNLAFPIGKHRHRQDRSRGQRHTSRKEQSAFLLFVYMPLRERAIVVCSPATAAIDSRCFVEPEAHVLFSSSASCLPSFRQLSLLIVLASSLSASLRTPTASLRRQSPARRRPDHPRFSFSSDSIAVEPFSASFFLLHGPSK